MNIIYLFWFVTLHSHPSGTISLHHRHDWLASSPLSEPDQFTSIKLEKSLKIMSDGLYLTDGEIVRDSTRILQGNSQTHIIFSPSLRNDDISADEGQEEKIEALFTVINSTFVLRDAHAHAGRLLNDPKAKLVSSNAKTAESLIAVIEDSQVSMIGVSIETRIHNSPFVLRWNTCSPNHEGNTLSLHSCTFWNSEGIFRPMSRLLWNGRSSMDGMLLISSCSLSDVTGVTREGIGMEMDKKWIGEGILFGFSSLLSSMKISNISSCVSDHSPLPRLPLKQKIVDCVVEKSIDVLRGSVVREIGVSGSTLSSNTTFSLLSKSTNTDVPHVTDESKFEYVNETISTSLSSKLGEAKATDHIWFVHCDFVSSSTGLDINLVCPISILHTTFSDIESADSSGCFALTVSTTDAVKVFVSDTCFSNCSSEGTHSTFEISADSSCKVVVVLSKFEMSDCESQRPPLYMFSVSKVSIYDSSFKRNKARRNGAVYLSQLDGKNEASSLLFDHNVYTEINTNRFQTDMSLMGCVAFDVWEYCLTTSERPNAFSDDAYFAESAKFGPSVTSLSFHESTMTLRIDGEGLTNYDQYIGTFRSKNDSTVLKCGFVKSNQGFTHVVQVGLSPTLFHAQHEYELINLEAGNTLPPPEHDWSIWFNKSMKSREDFTLFGFLLTQPPQDKCESEISKVLTRMTGTLIEFEIFGWTVLPVDHNMLVQRVGAEWEEGVIVLHSKRSSTLYSNFLDIATSDFLKFGEKYKVVKLWNSECYVPIVNTCTFQLQDDPRVHECGEVVGMNARFDPDLTLSINGTDFMNATYRMDVERCGTDPDTTTLELQLNSNGQLQSKKLKVGSDFFIPGTTYKVTKVWYQECTLSSTFPWSFTTPGEPPIVLCGEADNLGYAMSGRGGTDADTDAFKLKVMINGSDFEQETYIVSLKKYGRVGGAMDMRMHPTSRSLLVSDWELVTPTSFLQFGENFEVSSISSAKCNLTLPKVNTFTIRKMRVTPIWTWFVVGGIVCVCMLGLIVVAGCCCWKHRTKTIAQHNPSPMINTSGSDQYHTFTNSLETYYPPPLSNPATFQYHPQPSDPPTTLPSQINQPSVLPGYQQQFVNQHSSQQPPPVTGQFTVQMSQQGTVVDEICLKTP
ncbi:hypothetical protein BLNAU_3503 [Blattamonas nauphoetae]|uniref:Transmembrane protein n=1 Tax=Blattamonas nauphoetae TaxID=2049346 RepID=A0ABQ9YC92_9EUKA|nr:hypothetical protein BLNAU_3503 [Blattamonas nauphoetae]